MRSEKPICAPPRLSEVFPNVTFETVLMFVRLPMDLSRPLKEGRPALLLFAPVSSRRSMACQRATTLGDRTNCVHFQLVIRAIPKTEAVCYT